LSVIIWGPFSEDIDFNTKRFWEYFPQAYSHPGSDQTSQSILGEKPNRGLSNPELEKRGQE
jgi:hypothetical protein